ncbi:LuxR C-terminal-related transcriptional regulator [Streptomyces sp. NPDC057837]|uniref:helix-turn-helix transcriptional regulator n=1 Tax=Streptomyces sp. NPDC057837 TaxID=3346260 RepID=UPI0036A1FF84
MRTARECSGAVGFEGGSEALAITEAIGDAGLLSEDAVTAYGLISSGREVPAELADAVEELVRFGVVVYDGGRENRLVPLDPNRVARRHLEQVLAEAEAQLQQVRALPALAESLMEGFQRGQWRSTGGAEYLEDPAVVNARLDDVVGGAEFEILSAQPGGPRTREQLERSLERDTAALERGVAKRTLYRAVARDNSCTAEYVRAMTGRETGKRPEYRTLEAPFERAIIVDQRVAFISNHYLQGAPEHAAWLVTDKAMVAYIAAEFAARWRDADPWHGELRGRRTPSVDTITGVDGVRTTRRQREIMRDLAAGLSQRAIATRLGVSIRTVAKETAELKDLFDARSPEQLGYKWATSVDRLVDDSATEAGLKARVQPAA